MQLVTMASMLAMLTAGAGAVACCKQNNVTLQVLTTASQ